jgi:cytochrome P450
MPFWRRSEIAASTLPPGPPLSPVRFTWEWLRRPYPFLDEVSARYGDTFTFRLLGFPPLVFFSRPEVVKEIFTDDGSRLHAGPLNQSLKVFLGEHSVLMLDGAEHLRHRRLLLPPFHGERMYAYGQTMLDMADEAIDKLPQGQPFSGHKVMQNITLRVILRNVLGMREPAIVEEFAGVITQVLELATWPPLLLPAMQVDLGPYSPWGRFVRKRAEGDKLLLREVARRRREGTEGRKDVLSLLLDARDESGAAMTDAELRDELVTLLVAGHETTATALAWALRWVLADPKVEARLRQELTHSGELSPERIAKLEYLDAVVREALRLVPVIPLVGRILQEPMRIGGWDLPKGTAVVCSIYLTQRQRDLYPEPGVFNPDRFFERKMTPYEFFPFGGGIRRCLGMAFALYEMKMVLARLFTRTTLELVEPDAVTPVRRSVTIAPAKGLLLRLRDRR